MYVPAPQKPLPHRLVRFLAWKLGDAAASLVSRVTGFTVPDEPLQPFAQKIPMLLGRYELETESELRKLVKPGMVVIDGGAHVGYITRLLSQLVGPAGKVLAFEINEANLELLRRNTAHLGNVEIIAAGVAPSDGTATVYESGLSCGHSITATKPGLEAAGSIPTRSIASVLAERGLKQADLIKLDIEGGEPAVIRALPYGPVAVLFEIKRYIMEAGGESPEQFLSDLIDRGFTVWIEGEPPLTRTEIEAASSRLNKANIVAVRR